MHSHVREPKPHIRSARILSSAKCNQLTFSLTRISPDERGELILLATSRQALQFL